MADKDLPKGDEGALGLMITVKDDHLVMAFHEPTTWLAMHKEQVDSLIAVLQKFRKQMV